MVPGGKLVELPAFLLRRAAARNKPMIGVLQVYFRQLTASQGPQLADKD
jgi:hypothetical protein